jgi:cytoskeleton protein RodZ
MSEIEREHHEGMAGAADVRAPAQEVATVGARLKAAREAAKLTHHDIAQALKFSPRQIAALEADDYAALPGATIVRGFVRNYARLLKLDAAPLLQQLDAVLPLAPAEVRPPDNIGVAGGPRGMRDGLPLLAVALALLLAALLLALWSHFAPLLPSGETADAAAMSAASGGTSSASPGASPAPGEAPLAPSAAQRPTETAVLSSPQQTPSGGADAAAMSAASGGTSSASPGASPAPGEAPLAPSAAQRPTETAVLSSPQQTPSGRAVAATLQFSFAERSWVEVKDASKRLLHSGENPPGSELQLTGQPPFDIVIGNASKVTLSYDGKPVDLAPYTRAEVARLTLQ